LLNGGVRIVIGSALLSGCAGYQSNQSTNDEPAYSERHYSFSLTFPEPDHFEGRLVLIEHCCLRNDSISVVINRSADHRPIHRLDLRAVTVWYIGKYSKLTQQLF
jgi:hypothetical protein